MADIESNIEEWGSNHGWEADGDEWSRSWGGSDMQWYGTLLPRIHRYVPSKRIVEIACGHGRWTQFLAGVCDSLIAVDLVDKCVNACKKRFADNPNISCHKTDGKSLPMVEDRAADFIFSFDSLVHVNNEVMFGYIDEFSRVLSENGVAFIHHSNLGSILGKQSPMERKIRNKLHNMGVWRKEQAFFRDEGVGAELIADYAETKGLKCISQETFPWASGTQMVDCISVFVRKGSDFDRENQRFENPNMMKDAAAWKLLSELYGEKQRND